MSAQALFKSKMDAFTSMSNLCVHSCSDSLNRFSRIQRSYSILPHCCLSEKKLVQYLYRIIMLSWIIMVVGITMFPLFAGHILGWKSLFLDTSWHIHFGLFNHLEKLTVDSWSTTFQTASPALHIWRQWWQPALQKTKVRFNATLNGPWKIMTLPLGPQAARSVNTKQKVLTGECGSTTLPLWTS